MSNTEWEQETLALLHDAEMQKRNAELAREKAELTIQCNDRLIDGLRLSLQQYRNKYRLPNTQIPSPVSEEEYGHLGPSTAVEQWADRHNDEVSIKELAGELLRTRIYKDSRVAYNSVYTVLKRNRNFSKVRPGLYKRMVTSTNPALVNPGAPALPMSVIPVCQHDG